MPTLFRCGSLERHSVSGLIRKAVSYVPGARYEEIPGVGHSGYAEDPATFNQRVDAFLGRVLAAESAAAPRRPGA